MFSLDVLMPYYGNPEYLMRAVASVRRLEATDWRLTIVEDVHPQGRETEQRIADLGDDRIRYLRNDQNLGVARNTFKAMSFGERDFLVLMDYDDMLLPNYGAAVGRLFARHPQAVIVQPGIEVVDENDEPYLPLPDRVKRFVGPVNKDTLLSGQRAAVSILRGNWTYAPAICYRREAAAKLRYRPETATNTHDLARLVDLMMLGGSLAVGGEIAFRYRRHRRSESSTEARTGERFEQERRYYRQIAGELDAIGWTAARRAARTRLFSRLNALTRVPGAALHANGGALAALLRHAVV